MLNKKDNCPRAFNPDQKDKNKNGVGDACEGVNKDKVDERCDTDNDGVFDRDDNCKLVCNPDQKDANKNGIADVCDPYLLKDWVHIDPCPKKKKTCLANKAKPKQPKTN